MPFLTDTLNRRRLAQWGQLLPRVASYEEEFKALNTHDLRKKSLSLRYRAKSLEPLDRILPEAYAFPYVDRRPDAGAWLWAWMEQGQ